MIRHALIGGVLLALCAGAAARAQDEDKPKRPATRPLVQAPVVVDPASAPKPDAPYSALPPPLSTGAAFTSGGFGSGGFSNGGLRSNLPVIGDEAAVCRASCAKTRYVCLSSDDPVLCDPPWTQCLAACGR